MRRPKAIWYPMAKIVRGRFKNMYTLYLYLVLLNMSQSVTRILKKKWEPSWIEYQVVFLINNKNDHKLKNIMLCYSWKNNSSVHIVIHKLNNVFKLNKSLFNLYGTHIEVALKVEWVHWSSDWHWEYITFANWTILAVIINIHSMIGSLSHFFSWPIDFKPWHFIWVILPYSLLYSDKYKVMHKKQTISDKIGKEVSRETNRD